MLPFPRHDLPIWLAGTDKLRDFTMLVRRTVVTARHAETAKRDSNGDVFGFTSRNRLDRQW